MTSKQTVLAERLAELRDRIDDWATYLQRTGSSSREAAFLLRARQVQEDLNETAVRLCENVNLKSRKRRK